jgi:hypothetical protein
MLMHLAHWTSNLFPGNSGLKNVHGILSVIPRGIELQPKPVKVTYAQAAASHPLTSNISTQTDSAPPVMESDILVVCPYQPRMQSKLADPPKQLQTHESRKQSPLTQSTSDQLCDCAQQEWGCPTQPKVILRRLGYGHIRHCHKP